MIDKQPSFGNWTWDVEMPYEDRNANAGPVTLHDTPPVRQSCVLGPDGNPVLIDIPRRKIGFALTPSQN